MSQSGTDTFTGNGNGWASGWGASGGPGDKPGDQPSGSSGRGGRSGKGGKGGRGGGGRRGVNAMEMLMTAQYLMYSPGVQHLLMWGGQQAQQTVQAIGSLAVDQPRMQEAAQTWHQAASQLGSARDALETAGAHTAGWDGAGADRLREKFQRHLQLYGDLSDAYRGIGDTVARTAESMGEAHEALLDVTLAAGRSIAALGPDLPKVPQLSDGAAGGPAAVIVSSWQAVSDQLLSHCRGLADSATTAFQGLTGPA